MNIDAAETGTMRTAMSMLKLAMNPAASLTVSVWVRVRLAQPSRTTRSIVPNSQPPPSLKR